MTKKKKNLFQMDLIKNKYHIFNPENAKKKGYYPRELLQMIEELPNFEKELNIEVGEIYTVRAFFAISKPIKNEVGYQNGFLDVKLKKETFYTNRIINKQSWPNQAAREILPHKIGDKAKFFLKALKPKKGCGQAADVHVSFSS